MALKYKFLKLILILYAIFRLKRKDFIRFADILIQKQVAKDVKKYRWGVSYSLFDGEELLEYSIKSIRQECDYINVVYQDISWHGKAADTNLLAFLQPLKESNLIDEIIKFTPKLSRQGYKNERIKRTIGLRHAYQAKCRYFMTLDCDEFYRVREMRRAKKEIIFRGITHSYTPIFEYGLTANSRSITVAHFSVPFFSKINRLSQMTWNRKSCVVADHTKHVSLTPFSKQFYLTYIVQHHMTRIRKNYQNKLDNSSLATATKQALRFKYYKYIDVENEFNIPDFNK